MLKKIKEKLERCQVEDIYFFVVISLAIVVLVYLAILKYLLKYKKAMGFLSV